MQLWLLHVTVTYTNYTSRMFFPFFSAINYVQKNSSNTVKFSFPSGVKNQMLMLLSSTIKYFFVSRKSYPGPSLIQFRLNKSKSVSKMVIPRQLFQGISKKSKNFVSLRLSF